jgi:FkbM family methyltransferase
VGRGQRRRGWVVTIEMCWSRVIAGTLVFSKDAPDILWGLARNLTRLEALPEKLVWNREAAIASGVGRPNRSRRSAGSCRWGWVILDARDPQSKGALERSYGGDRTPDKPSICCDIDWNSHRRVGAKRSHHSRGSAVPPRLMHNCRVIKLARLRKHVPIVDEAIRVLGATPVVRAAVRWTTVTEPVRFAAAELFGPRGRLQVHQIEGGRVVLRHRTRDIDVFDEIFVGNRGYEPPRAVAIRFRDRPPAKVLDLGGNVGLFGVYALAQWPAATITSVEPDAANLPLLGRCIEVNEAAARWKIIAACAASRPGVVAFSGGQFADSAIALDGEDVTADVVAVDALELLQYADFAKIDIEGAEWELLLDERFAASAPAVLVMEWHQRGCPMPDGYQAALDILRRAGYDVEGEPPSVGQHYGTIWAWKPTTAQNGVAGRSDRLTA